MGDEPTVAFPGKAVGDGQDLLPPLQSLLVGLNVLPKPEDVEDDNNFWWAFRGTPQSVAILESGATALSKGWTVVIGALGGAAAITAAVKNFWQSSPLSVQIALLAATAVVVTAAIIAIAQMVSSELKARATGAVALYDARKAVALQFLASSLSVSQSGGASSPAAGTADNAVLVAIAAAQGRAAVIHVPTGTSGHISGVRQVKGETQLQYRRDGDEQVDWCSPGEFSLTEFSFEGSS
jgi:hypothetical protein